MLSSTGSTLVSTSQSHGSRIHSKAKGNHNLCSPIAQLTGHTSSISSVSFVQGSSLTTNTTTPSLLASCDINGNAFLWNIDTRRVICQFGDSTNADPAGLRVCSLGGSGGGGNDNNNHPQTSYLVYHTRGTDGIVKIFDINRLLTTTTASKEEDDSVILWNVSTKSRTFCAVATSSFNNYMIVTPSEDECVATLYDVRISSKRGPILSIHGAGRPGSSTRNIISSGLPEHGMLTSLAMCSSPSTSSASLVIACGMESGDLYFHDCRYNNNNNNSTIYRSSSDNLNKDTDNHHHHNGSSSSFSPPRKDTASSQVALSSLLGQALLAHDQCSSSSRTTRSIKMQNENQTVRDKQLKDNDNYQVSSSSWMLLPSYAYLNISKEPILALDVIMSSKKDKEMTKEDNKKEGDVSDITTSGTPRPSSFSCDKNIITAVCGCAGDHATLTSSNDTTGAVVRAAYHDSSISNFGLSNSPQITYRFQTCDLGPNSVGGKPGIASCSIRTNDSRIFAVGGWDHRCRLFTLRGKYLANLRGHNATVTTCDWSLQGLLATGSADGTILIWNPYPSR